MAETFDFTTNAKEVLGDFDKISSKLGQLATDYDNLSDEQKKAFTDSDELKKYERELDGLSTKLAESKKQQEANTKESIRLTDQIKKQARETTILGVNVGDVIDGLKNKRKALQGTTTGLTGSAKALRVFKVALASTGIGLIVVALGSLVAFLTRTQKGMDLVSKATAGAGAVFDVITDRASALGEGIIELGKAIFNAGAAFVKFITLDFKGAVESNIAATEAFSKAQDAGSRAVNGLVDEIREETRQAIALDAALKQVTRSSLLLDVQRSASRARIKELNKLAEDTTKGARARAEAAREAGAIETALVNEQIANQKRRIAIALGETQATGRVNELLNQVAAGALNADQLLGELGISNSTVTDLEEFTQLASDLFNTQAESLEVQTTLQNKLNTINQQAQAQAEAARKAESDRLQKLQQQYERLGATLLGEVADAQTAQLTAEEKVQAARAKSIEQINQLANELRELEAQFSADGLEFAIDVDAKVKELLDFVELEAERALAAIELDRIDDIDLEIDVNPVVSLTEPDDIGSDIDRVFEQLRKSVEAEQNDTRSFFEQLADGAEDFSIYKLLGLDPDDENDARLISGIKDAVGQVVSSLQQLNAARVEAARVAVQSADNQVQAAERALDREISLSQTGVASNISLRQKELANAEAARQKALQQQQEAQRKEIQLQTALQAVNLITAGANIFKSLSPGFPFTLPLAVGAIGLMLSAFNAQRKAAKAAVDAQSFRDGGGGKVGKDGVIVGKRHSAGGVPLEVEGGEFFGTNGKQFGVVKREMTKKHFDLLTAINADDRGAMASILAQMVDVPKYSFSKAGISNQFVSEVNERPAQSINVNVADNSEQVAELRQQNQYLKRLVEKNDKVNSWTQGNKTYVREGNKTRIIRG